MKTSAMLPSKYLKTGDFEAGEAVVTVKSWKKEKVSRDDAPEEFKFVLYFEEYDKGLVLNATNIKRMEKYVGDDTDTWIGSKITVYVDDNVPYGSEIVSGLRIKGVGRRNAKPAASSDDEVNRKLRDASDDESIPF